MQIQNDRFRWRTNFIGGLQLLAQAAARLPVGVQDPVLSGASAVELYTGGLWPSRNLEVLTPHPQALAAELFGVGFRWCERPRQSSAGLWHPGLQIGLEIIDPSAMHGSAERANRLTVVINLRPFRSAGPASVRLKVVGIEDLIALQVRRWLADGARSGEFALRLQTLVGLGREGVGGPLREGYLQRRVTWESDGQVVLELSRSNEEMSAGHMARAMDLTRMRVLISAWCSRNGLISDDPRTSRRKVDDCAWGGASNLRPTRMTRGAGRSERPSAQIVPFKVAPTPPPG